MSEPLITWSLRKGLPLSMVFAVAIALIFDRIYEYSIVKSAAVENDSMVQVKEMSYSLARDYSRLLMAGDLHELRLSIRARSTQTQIKKIVVSDEWGQVIASTNLNDNEKKIEQIDNLFRVEEFNKTISTNRSHIKLSNDGQAVLGYTPVSLPLNSNELRSLRQGLLYIHMDITVRKAAIWNDLFSTNSIARWIITFVVTVLLLGFFLKRHLFAPLRHLEKTAVSLGQGDWSAESHLVGDSEFAKLGHVFNKMRQKILKEREALVINEQELKALNRKLEHEASTDSLTSLANRRAIIEKIQYEQNLADRYAKNFSIIMMDIDYFKSINDTFGHNMGDRVLRQVGQIICKKSRKTDIAARWGGEEFLILCPETGLDEAANLAELLRQIIATHDFDIPSSITASFGVANYEANCTQDQLIKRADDALYAAKADHRNNVKKSTDKTS